MRSTRAASATSPSSAARPAWRARRCSRRAPRMPPAPGASSSSLLEPGATRRRRIDPLRPELMFRRGWSRRRRRDRRGDDRGLRLRRRRRGARARCRACSASPRGWCSTPTRSTPSPPTPRCRRCSRRARARGHATVLTPHPLEAARLLGARPRRGAGRSAAARRASWPQRFALRGRAQGLGHRDRRARTARRASTPPATPRSPAPAPATCSPAGSAGAGRRPAATRVRGRDARPSIEQAPRPSRQRPAPLRAADLVERLHRRARGELTAASAPPLSRACIALPISSVPWAAPLSGTVSPSRSEIASNCSATCSAASSRRADVDALRQRDVRALERAGAGAQDRARRRVLGDQREQARRHRAGLEQRQHRLGHTGLSVIRVAAVGARQLTRMSFFAPSIDERLHQADQRHLGGAVVGLAEVAVQARSTRSSSRCGRSSARASSSQTALVQFTAPIRWTSTHERKSSSVHLREALVAQDAGVVDQDVDAAPVGERLRRPSPARRRSR